jgi:hypothetical protein
VRQALSSGCRFPGSSLATGALVWITALTKSVLLL